MPADRMAEDFLRILENSGLGDWAAGLLLFKSLSFPELSQLITLAVVDHLGSPFVAEISVMEPELPKGLCQQASKLPSGFIEPEMAVHSLNKALGRMTVQTDFGLNRHQKLRELSRASRIKPIFDFYADPQSASDCLALKLGDTAALRFIVPLARHGNNRDRATQWANDFSAALLVHQALIKAATR